MTELTLSKIASILFILIVVVVIILFSTGNLKAAGKIIPGLDIIDDFEDKTYQQSFLINFNTFINNLKNCESSKNKNCICDSKLSLLEGYGLEIMNSKISLLKGENKLEEKNFSTSYILEEGLNCEFKEFVIKFDDKGNMRIDIPYNRDIHFYDDNDLKNKLIYKNRDKFCWVTKKISKSKLKSINIC